MPDNATDDALARYAVHTGLADAAKVEAARQRQAESAETGVELSLGQALVQLGALTNDQLETVEKRMKGLTQVGNFKFVKKLGEGGMGAVYLAEETTSGRKAAIKVLSKKYAGDDDFVARFRREARATSQLKHPNIVSAFTFGEDHGHYYYAMEYCEGEALDATLAREIVLPCAQALDIARQVARGLAHAHENGFIHRDIKPANILVTSEGVAKILDLGLTKNITDAQQSFNTETGVSMGTPHYISPEQARGEKRIDGRSDIYSLGATLYHLLVGQTPFEGTSAAIVVMKHLNESLKDPREIRPALPGPVVRVIEKMMAKAADDRYRDCGELLADLELAGKAQSGPEDMESVRAGFKRAESPPTLPMEQASVETRAGHVKPLTKPTYVSVPYVASSAGNAMYWVFGAIATVLICLVLTVLIMSRNPQPELSKAPETKPPEATIPAPIPVPTPTLPAVTPELLPPTPPIQKPIQAIELPKPVAPVATTQTPGDLPKELSFELRGGVKIDFVLIPAGKFEMGTRNNTGLEAQHTVNISAFYMSKFHVTQAQYDAVVVNHQSRVKGEDHPVDDVSWIDAAEFCKNLTARLKSKLPASMEIQLPTEAQFEYASRAGSQTRYMSGETDTLMKEYSWTIWNSQKKSHPVGEKKPNAFGLYDMNGNVWQWCRDWYSTTYYAHSPDTDPPGPDQGDPTDKGPARVLRGGSFSVGNEDCRLARRHSAIPSQRYYSFGFRVAIARP